MSLQNFKVLLKLPLIDLLYFLRLPLLLTQNYIMCTCAYANANVYTHTHKRVHMRMIMWMYDLH